MLPDSTLINLKGKVVSVKTTVYEAKMKFGVIQKGNIHWFDENSQITFDSEGMILEILKSDLFNKIQSRELRLYDSRHLLREIHSSSSASDLNLHLAHKTTFSYERDCLSEITSFDPDGIINYKIRFENKGGHLVRQFNFSADGQLQSSSCWKAADLQTARTSYDRNGNLIHTTTFEYTPAQQWSKLVADDVVVLIEYDSHGNVSKVTNGQATPSQSILICPGENYRYTYLYDDQGNWTQRIAFRNADSGCPATLTERELTYFSAPPKIQRLLLKKNPIRHLRLKIPIKRPGENKPAPEPTP